MKSYASGEIRNVALVGHGGSGKTTLAESILWVTKSVNRLGRVDDETSTFDFEPEEHKRKTSISTSLGHVEWKKNKINLVDTPGGGNFLVDTRLALDVVDAAVLVVAAPDGVQVYTEKTWQYADELGLPAAVFITKMDRERADFERALADVRETLSDKAVALTIPIGAEAKFGGVIDLASMKALKFAEDGISVKVEEIPANLKDAAHSAHEKLIEAVASADDTLLEHYLEKGTLDDDEFKTGFAKAVRARALFPVLCGSGGLNVGVQPLLDLVVAAFPSPAERPVARGTLGGAPAERAPDAAQPVAAYVWKTVNSDVGRLSLLRVLSGKLTGDCNLLSVNHDKREHLGQLYALQGKGRENVAEAMPGDLVAVAKLKMTKTGDTLADEKSPFQIKRPEIPLPLIKYAIRPKSKGDEDKLAMKLNEVIDADVALQVQHDAASKEILLGGTGQIHIEATVDKLHRMGVDVELLPPKIPYLETIRGVAKNIEGKHKKQTGGKGQFGVVYVDIAPLPRGSGFEFEDAVVGGAVPRQFIPAVEKGIRARMNRGVVAGYQCTDVKVRLFDGKYHDVDSDSRSFEIAGSKAFQIAFKQAKPVLLEPVMKLEVIVPEESMGDVIGDLNQRRGRVEGMDTKGKNQVIKGQVPMAETLKYASDLRSLTGGRGSFTIEFDHYEELPGHLADKVIAEHKVAEEEE